MTRLQSTHLEHSCCFFMSYCNKKCANIFITFAVDWFSLQIMKCYLNMYVSEVRRYVYPQISKNKKIPNWRLICFCVADWRDPDGLEASVPVHRGVHSSHAGGHRRLHPRPRHWRWDGNLILKLFFHFTFHILENTLNFKSTFAKIWMN